VRRPCLQEVDLRPLTILAFGLLCAACANSSNAHKETAAVEKHASLGSWGVDLTAMDRSTKPGDDFFQFVNGVWLKTVEIPPERTNAGTFQDLQILSEKRMKGIAADLDTRPYVSLGNEEKKLRDLYEAFEDTAQIEARGLAPAKSDLDRIARLKTRADVARAMGSVKLSAQGIFNVDISVDPKNSNAYVIHLAQGGLGLPDREYYLRSDRDLAATRQAYKKYLADTLTLAGAHAATARAQRIFDLETAIAKVSWSRADRRDAEKTYNPLGWTELQALAPDFPWQDNFQEAGLPIVAPSGERQVIVAEKSAFPAIAKIFASTPVPVWRDYLTVRYLHQYAAFLPKRFDNTDFGFYGTVLSGRTQQLDRPARGAHLLDTEIGEALGKLYVARFFPPEAKANAEALVSNILKAYEADIRTLSWMSDVTRQKALDKLHAFTPHIGYPDKWRDYSTLTITRGDLLGDVQAANLFEWNRRVKRLDQAVDKNEWELTPSTINAYYRRDFNAIFFPAGILQPPFFDPSADDAVNFGGIGVVIGHEISHGFDDQGSKYDGQGLLANWWTPDDRKAFDARTSRLSNQFDTYEALPGLHVIGRNTLGENIADLAGLDISLKAYRISLRGKAAPVLDGFTGDQRYFLSFGQIWRTKYRDSALRTQVVSNPHSPAKYRVIGPTRNDDAWYEAFDVKPGDRYFLPPDQRVELW
jgi:putative endopeptidase